MDFPAIYILSVAHGTMSFCHMMGKSKKCIVITHKMMYDMSDIRLSEKHLGYISEKTVMCVTITP